MRPDRFTVAAITTIAVLAGLLAATWPPTHYTPGPLLTCAIVYTATVLGLARLTHLPPARTLAAATLLTAAILRGVLAGLVYALDAAHHAALTHLAPRETA